MDLIGFDATENKLISEGHFRIDIEGFPLHLIDNDGDQNFPCPQFYGLHVLTVETHIVLQTKTTPTTCLSRIIPGRLILYLISS